jgi:hypothetical protein
MAELPLSPKRSELGWTLKPWFHIASSLLMLAFSISFFLEVRADGIGDTWLSFWGLVLLGAVIGLIGIPARLKYLETHWRKGKYIYIETTGIKDTFKLTWPFFAALVVGFVIELSLRFNTMAGNYVPIGCLFTWGFLANYLWWRSLPE